ncbi:MAG: alpha/beta fold hydrolase [Myxococcales bacterium]|nr:MAG: alpha/beta fold hydrolase [Myxococcales bacterium]
MSGYQGEDHLGRPPKWATALEVRAIGERAAMDMAMPLLERLPKGDGHTVVILPGFTADDRSTRPLRDLLNRLGYDARGWGLGVNIGPSHEIIHGLEDLFATVLEEARQPFSIIGWSLGGIYAREVARQLPDHVRQVISLGSPLEMVRGDDSATRPLWEELAPLFDDNAERTVRESHRPLLPVPTSAVYTRTDGIVPWRSCLTVPGPTSENIEVYGSHCGLGLNPSVAYAVADRLAQPHDDWRPFTAPLHLSGLFPVPANGPLALPDAA